MGSFCKFCLLLVFLTITACSDQENLSSELQDQYYNKAYNSVFYSINPIPDMEAADLFRKAAESRHAPSQWHLGRLYALGRGVEKDLNQSVSWKEKAADQGYLSAELDMAEAYIFGEGVEQNFKKAFDYLLSARDKEHPRAYLLLSVFYFVGLEVEKDVEVSRNLRSKSNELYKSDLGLKFSQYGSPVTIAPKEAENITKRFVEILNSFDRKAANSGDVLAQYQSSLYSFNIKNYDEAYLWALAAARAGDVESKALLAAIVDAKKRDFSSEEKVDIYFLCFTGQEHFSKLDNEKARNKYGYSMKCVQNLKTILSEEEYQTALRKIEKPEYQTYKRVDGEFILKR